MNPFESGQQKIIPAVLLYAFYQNQCLMIHRDHEQKAEDIHDGKWNGLGGKTEPHETQVECAVREFQEESGIKTTTQQWSWSGQLQFPNFKPHKHEDWFVTVFKTELSQLQAESVIFKNKEGTLHWIPKTKIISLNLWEGDRVFLPLVLENKPFEGTFFYQNGKLTRFFCNEIMR